jgi:hypothetical protein
MSRSERCLRCCVLASFFALIALPVRSAYVVETGPYVVPAAEGDYTTSLTVDQFDPGTTPWPAYAHLLSIEFHLTGILSGNLGIENEDVAGVSEFSVTLSNVLTLSRDGTLITTATPEYAASGTLDMYDGNTNYLGASGETLAVSGSNTSDALTELQADLDAFTGDGTIILDLAIPAEALVWTVTGGKLYSTADSPLVGASLTVTYTYIPEPSAGALLCCFALLAQLRRRRKRQAGKMQTADPADERR